MACTLIIAPRAWMRGAECIDGLLQLRPPFDRFAGRLLAVDFMTPLGAQGADLALQVLAARGYPASVSLGVSCGTGPKRY